MTEEKNISHFFGKRFQKCLTIACKINDHVVWNVLRRKAYEQIAGGASIHTGRAPLTSMIYEAEKPGTRNAGGQHAVTVIQTRWYATCCFCNAGNYSRGAFLREYSLAFRLYWRGKRRMTEKRWRRADDVTEVEVERWTWGVEDPSYGGSKGHPEVLQRLPAEWQVAHFHTYFKRQQKV